MIRLIIGKAKPAAKQGRKASGLSEIAELPWRKVVRFYKYLTTFGYKFRIVSLMDVMGMPGGIIPSPEITRVCCISE